MTNLKETHPHLAKIWSNDNARTIESVSKGSHYLAIWDCPAGHLFKKQVADMARGGGCAYCAGKAVLPGFNDIATTAPELLEGWLELNAYKPTELTRGSRKTIKWQCSAGHIYTATPNRRTAMKTGCPECCNRETIRSHGIRAAEDGRTFADKYPNLISEWHPDNDMKPHEVAFGSHYWAKWKCSAGHEWECKVQGRGVSGSGCPECYPGHTSKPEKELAEFIQSFTHAETNVRDVIKPFELDVYIPAKRIAIEFNGLYWHSEKYAGKMQHYNKWKSCNDKGIQLITIWEDDWKNNKDVVKRMLQAKIGGRKAIGARKTTAKFISAQQAAEFLDYWHIQGSAGGSHYIGLFTDKLVAVCVVTKQSGAGRLDRYASSVTIVGGLDKCLAMLPYNKFITFADLAVSTGALYEKTGWVEDEVLKPDYKYIVGGERVHKFNYRLKRFRDDPSLEYKEGLSESQLAALNGLKRIYDCGKVRYTKTV